MGTRTTSLLATLTLLLAAGCSSSDDTPSTTSEPSTNPPDVVQAPERPDRPAPARITYTSTCQDPSPQTFVTGDLTENTDTGYRFIADVTLRNTGDRPGFALVSVQWFLVGGDVIRTPGEPVTVPAGGRKTVGFTEPATLGEIEAMAAHQPGDRLCKAFAAS